MFFGVTGDQLVLIAVHCFSPKLPEFGEDLFLICYHKPGNVFLISFQLVIIIKYTITRLYHVLDVMAG